MAKPKVLIRSQWAPKIVDSTRIDRISQTLEVDWIQQSTVLGSLVRALIHIDNYSGYSDPSSNVDFPVNILDERKRENDLLKIILGFVEMSRAWRQQLSPIERVFEIN